MIALRMHGWADVERTPDQTPVPGPDTIDPHSGSDKSLFLWPTSRWPPVHLPLSMWGRCERHQDWHRAQMGPNWSKRWVEAGPVARRALGRCQRFASVPLRVQRLAHEEAL